MRSGTACAIEVEHRRQTNRVRKPVVHPELGGQRVRKRMTGTKPLLKCDRPHHRCLQHVLARPKVVAVVGRCLERAMAEANAAKCNRVGHRVIAHGCIGLDAVGQGVHARRRGHGWGHRSRHHGIENRDVRQQERREDHGLSVRGLQRHDAAPTDFAPGSRGRRDGDHGGKRTVDFCAASNGIVVLGQWGGVCRGEAHQLGHIEHASAPDTQHQVSLEAVVGSCRPKDFGLERVR